MRYQFERLGLAASLLVLFALLIVAFPAQASTGGFSVPDDVALRIRLDDTLTSVDSEVGDPFSATVVESGDYQGARVYGHISEIDTSGRIKGRTSMMLRFDRVVMPDGRRAPIHAEIIELYHAPSGEKVDVEGAIESGGRGQRALSTQRLGPVPAHCWVQSLAAAGARVSVQSSAAPADWGQRLSTEDRKSPWAAARKC